MKKRVIETMLCVLATVAIFGLFGIVGHIETHYSVKGTVIEVVNDEVVVETADGNAWVFIGEGFSAGDTVMMEMFTAGTDLNKYDDEIHAVEKIA